VRPFLLDVNVLIALSHEQHVAHHAVRRWFQHTAAKQWVTCPLTEAAFVRIVSNPRLAEAAVDISEALEMLHILTQMPGHRFWPVNVGFLDAVEPFLERLFGHQQVSDAYLLGLAVKNKGRLATLDHGIEALAGSEFSDYLTVLRT
jgi:toxin-antitoxin system PIN domain toxin